MEYTQWDPIKITTIKIIGLNPCCNGIYSMRVKRSSYVWKNFSLNPCCNGIYSMRLC